MGQDQEMLYPQRRQDLLQQLDLAKSFNERKLEK
jgi:hypothetical protein